MASVEESTSASSKKLFTRSEVLETKNGKDAFIIVHNSVYNVTKYLSEVNINTFINIDIYSYSS